MNPLITYWKALNGQLLYHFDEEEYEKTSV